MYRLDRFHHRKKYYLSSLIPFARIINEAPIVTFDKDGRMKTPPIVLNKNGSMQTTWTYRGPDLDSAIMEQLGVMTAQLNSSFQSLDKNFVLYFEAQRMPTTRYLTDVYFPDPVTKAIDAERRHRFSSGSYYESNYYMTLYWMPPSDNQSLLKELVVEGTGKTAADAREYMMKFQETVGKIFHAFLEMRIPANYMTANEIATYLHSTVSSKIYPILLPEHPVLLDSFIADDPMDGGMYPKLGKKHMAVIVPLSYPSISQFSLFDNLNRLGFSYRWVTRYFCLDKTDSLSNLSTFKREWGDKVKPIKAIIQEIYRGFQDNSNVNENAVAKVNEVKSASFSVESDEVNYGYYSTSIVVLDEDLDELKEKAKKIEQVFTNLGLKAKTEDLNAVDAWFSMIPGNVCHQIRRPLISTGNLAHMVPLSDVWPGPSNNKHLQGPCLIYAQTEGNTPFRLNLHVGDVGHTLLIGPTGAGKSVHLNMIAAQFRKYKNAQVFIFDKGASSRILTEAVGGQFYDIGNEKSAISFQPLSQIDDEAERKWALEWLCDYIREENVPITPEVKTSLWTALLSMASMPAERRTISLLVASIQDKNLRNALQSLTLQGSYGSIFDSDQDNLQFSSWQSFETEKLMNIPRIVGPTLMYIFHRIEQQLTGSPTVIILDEGWVFFDNEMFAGKIREWLKVLRKANASVIFATQSLADIVKNPIFPTVLESCQSRIFLPNDKALEKSMKENYFAFGLNSKQVQIIAGAVPKRQYYYTSPLGARIYDLKIGPTALAYVAVDKADLIECQRILDEHGCEEFVDRWKEYKGLDDGGKPI